MRMQKMKNMRTSLRIDQDEHTEMFFAPSKLVTYIAEYIYYIEMLAFIKIMHILCILCQFNV